MKVQTSRLVTALVALAVSLGLLVGSSGSASADEPVPSSGATAVSSAPVPSTTTLASATVTAQDVAVKSTAKASTTKKKKKTKGEKALAFAKKQLGEKYKYGAAGPNRWDCSGLTMKAWGAAGKKLPHSAKAQYKKGKKIKKSKLRKGDLVFFYSGPSHVGIYAGGGKVIHAPKPGSKVSYIKMKYMPFKGARRPG
ncbi:C40 family peptidase [Microlunatus flavus]|uniref:Cell wall-associated hydrolase, NlpC family n=1 Tax=Microlunatus flavus TaxID=1036181 RepID=A0A1H9LRZ8_9ACTN|nr:C40 family peptidase [Microlunatus flavus]SER14241.1 Cell wall-associated hydrolase, NlpC family [Microlunatus flavus]